MTLPPINDPRVPWRIRRLRQAAAGRSTQRRTDAEERVDELRAWVERERIAHELRYHTTMPQPHLHEPAQTRVEQIEELTRIGMDPAGVVAHLGIKPGSVVRALERAGRKDLTPPFERLRRRDRKKPCPMCEKELINEESNACRACVSASRTVGRRAS